jgi:hypothetical protein
MTAGGQPFFGGGELINARDSDSGRRGYLGSRSPAIREPADCGSGRIMIGRAGDFQWAASRLCGVDNLIDARDANPGRRGYLASRSSAIREPADRGSGSGRIATGRARKFQREASLFCGVDNLIDPRDTDPGSRGYLGSRFPAIREPTDGGGGGITDCPRFRSPDSGDGFRSQNCHARCTLGACLPLLIGDARCEQLRRHLTTREAKFCSRRDQSGAIVTAHPTLSATIS